MLGRVVPISLCTTPLFVQKTPLSTTFVNFSCLYPRPIGKKMSHNGHWDSYVKREKVKILVRLFRPKNQTPLEWPTYLGGLGCCSTSVILWKPYCCRFLAKMQFSGSLFFIGRAKGKTVNLYWHNTYADIRAVLVHIGGLTSERENSPLLLKRRE